MLREGSAGCEKVPQAVRKFITLEEGSEVCDCAKMKYIVIRFSRLCEGLAGCAKVHNAVRRFRMTCEGSQCC